MLISQFQEPLETPTRPTHPRPLRISRHLFLRAILIVPSPDLDLVLWNAVLKEEDEESQSLSSR